MDVNHGWKRKWSTENNKKSIFQGQIFHCASHRLNLVVNDLNLVPEFRNTVGTVKEVIRFFRESPLRRKLIMNIPMLCETRWSSKYKSIKISFENFVITFRSN